MTTFGIRPSSLPSMSEPLLSLTFIARSSLLLRDRHMTASASIVGMGQDPLDANRVLGAIAHSEEHPAAFPKHQRSEEHTSELQSLMRIQYAVFCLQKQNPV